MDVGGKIMIMFGQEGRYTKKNAFDAEQFICPIGGGLDASIIRGKHTVGGKFGFYEMALISSEDSKVVFPNEFYDIFEGDVRGYMTEDDVIEILADLKERIETTGYEFNALKYKYGDLM